MHIDLDVDVWICMHLKACKTDKLQMIVIGTRQHDWETFCQFLIRFSSVNGGFFWSAHFVFIEQIDPWNLNSASAQHQHSSRTMSHLKMVWRQIAHHLDLQLGGAQRISINSRWHCGSFLDLPRNQKRVRLPMLHACEPIECKLSLNRLFVLWLRKF